MERCDRYFHGEELSDDKNVPTICVLCTNESQYANQSEISTQISDALLKNKEKHSTDEIAGLLRQYYEGAPLFYSKEPPKAKVFKPILLYHSCSKGDSSSRENSLHGFCKSDRIPLVPDDSQHRHLNTTLTDTEIHGRPETTTLERDEKTPVDILQHPDNNSGWIHSNVRYKTSKEVESLPCGVQSEKIAVKSEFIQPLFSAANETLQYSYHRSAFSQPRRFPDFLPDYSDIMDTYVRSSLKLQRAAHSSTEFCGFQCFLCGHPVCLNTEGYINANMQSFTCSSCSSFLPSNRFQHCIGENCLGDLSFHPELGTTRQLPIFSHTYNSYHYEFLKFSPLLHSNQIVEAQCKIDVSEKTQGDCIYDSQDFLQSDSSIEVVPKKIQKVAAVEKPYKCECGRAFARNEELTRHMRIHSGHRPFQCSLCAKSFGRKDHLKKHRTTHLHISEKKVHVCNIEDCQQRYTRSDALARHQWAIHGIRASVPK